MATVIFFHSVYGLRSLEHEAVERVQAAGHKAFAPDLYDGLIARSIEDARLSTEAIAATEMARHNQRRPSPRSPPLRSRNASRRASLIRQPGRRPFSGLVRPARRWRGRG